MKVIIKDKYRASHEVVGLERVTGTKFNLAGIYKQYRGLFDFARFNLCRTWLTISNSAICLFITTAQIIAKCSRANIWSMSTLLKATSITALSYMKEYKIKRHLMRWIHLQKNYILRFHHNK